MLNVHSIFKSFHRPGITPTTISEFLQREERLRFIAHELSHRNKNLLAVVQAIAAQTGRGSVGLEQFQTQFSERLKGLSCSIDLLVDEDGRGASIADLVSSQLEPFGGVDGVRIAATGADVMLNPEATQYLGLALHELATNASKYGALSLPEGEIVVRWEIGSGEVGRRCFRLIWQERNGPEVTPPASRGFGHVVLQRLTGPSLHGRVNHEFESRGVCWTLEAPLAAVTRLRSI